MNETQRRECECLVSALCDGVLDASQRGQLEAMLRDSAECRDIYLRYVDMHARLTVHPRLSSGMPLSADVPEGDDDDAARDDAIVLGRARAAWSSEIPVAPGERIDTSGGRFVATARRFMALGGALLAALVVWQVASRSQAEQSLPVIRAVTGEATIENGAASRVALVGDRLRRGDRLRLAEDEPQATLAYGDGTRVVVHFASAVEVPAEASDVDLRLLSGTMEVDAARRPPDDPLVFATDHARYVVLGTRFRLYREEEASRLELDEGRVRLERFTGDASGVAATDVTAGQVAVARTKIDVVDIKPIASGRAELLQSIRKAGTAVAFTQVADTFATSHAERGLKSWRLGGAAPLSSFEAKIGHAESLAATGEVVVQVARVDRRGVVARWRPGAATAESVTLPQSNVRSFGVSPDGEFVAESGDEATRVYRVHSAPGEPVLRLSTVAEFSTKGKAWCLALAPQARCFAAGFWDGKVTVHRIDGRIDGGDAAERNGEGTSTLVFERKLAHTPTHVALAADGASLAVFTQKDGLLVFDVATGERRQIWAPGAASVTCVTFSVDGEHLVAGLSDGTARIWSVADGSAQVVVNVGHVPRDIAWLPTRRLLATANGDVRLWRCELQ